MCQLSRIISRKFAESFHYDFPFIRVILLPMKLSNYVGNIEIFDDGDDDGDTKNTNELSMNSRNYFLTCTPSAKGIVCLHSE